MSTQKPATNANPAKTRALADAAEQVRRYLDLETLDDRKRDALDFHDISVASLREVIAMAFEAGYAAGAGAR